MTGPSFAIAAAGTGGHVYPGLAVGEALVTAGVERSRVLFVGGHRLESEVYPAAGFPFVPVEVRGLQRRLSVANLGIPWVVGRAVAAISEALSIHGVTAVLAMGGYVTVPTVLAARRRRLPIAVSEQNAGAGLGNRFAARFARRVFGSFQTTHGLPGAEWMGNPIRRELAEFDREGLRDEALRRWGLEPGIPVLGVFGGSLGAGALNAAVATMLTDWRGPPLQVLHLAGRGYADVAPIASVSPIRWVVLDFCDEMERFYAASDLVVARAGGSVAELTATATPAVLVPGGFGSVGHQRANATALEEAGAARVLSEADLEELGETVRALLQDPAALSAMAAASRSIARPGAADDIARALIRLGTP
jgi:UDP-N-acetylglucosamine--N-acetylmuramyl-(pentapeptide) pyrophosphoryl-undecaprenol N-acetylglucosamine transferase